MRQVGEPSVEEILESIKKVIARDNRPAEAAPRHDQFGRQGNGTGIEDEDEVLDLAESSEYLASTEEAADGPLVPEQTVSSMRESLAALAMLAEPGAAPQIVRSGETSLEGLTRELLQAHRTRGHESDDALRRRLRQATLETDLAALAQ